MTNDINLDNVFQSLTNDDLKVIFDSLCGFSTGFTFITSVSPEKFLYSYEHIPCHLSSLINPTQDDTLFTILNKASGIDNKSYEWLIKQIISKPLLGNLRYTYSIELPWKLFDEGDTWFVYKFSPLSFNIKGKCMVFISGEFRMASGYLINKLQRVEIGTGKISLKNIGDSEWYYPDITKLSSIEKTILTLSNTGMTTDIIAGQTNKSKESIKSIRKRIINKLNVDNLKQAIAITAG